MKVYSEDLPDKNIVEEMLISLISKLDPKPSTIEDTKDLSKTNKMEKDYRMMINHQANFFETKEG
ncbi:hypothetical protein HN51_044984 [Arachis hypogaea]